jgi:hypothetical protein
MLTDETLQRVKAPYEAWTPELNPDLPLKSAYQFLFNYPKNNISQFVFQYYAHALPKSARLNEVILFLHKLISKPNEYRIPPRFDETLPIMEDTKKSDLKRIFLISSLFSVSSYYIGLPFLSLVLRCVREGSSLSTKNYSLIDNAKLSCLYLLINAFSALAVRHSHILYVGWTILNNERKAFRRPLENHCQGNATKADLEYKKVAMKLFDAMSYHDYLKFGILMTFPLAAPSLALAGCAHYSSVFLLDWFALCCRRAQNIADGNNRLRDTGHAVLVYCAFVLTGRFLKDRVTFLGLANNLNETAMLDLMGNCLRFGVISAVTYAVDKSYDPIILAAQSAPQAVRRVVNYLYGAQVEQAPQPAVQPALPAPAPA